MATTPKNQQNQNSSDFGLPAAEFQPIDDGNQWFKITVIVLLSTLFVVLGLGAAYLFWYRMAESDIPVEVSDLENKEHERELDAIDEGFSHREEAAEDKKHEYGPSHTDTLTPREGLVTISTPQGHYYIIVGSYIDGDLAKDYAKQLLKHHECVMILPPNTDTAFSKVALVETDSYEEARAKKEVLKAEYGQDIWIAKY